MVRRKAHVNDIPETLNVIVRCLHGWETGGPCEMHRYLRRWDGGCRGPWVPVGGSPIPTGSSQPSSFHVFILEKWNLYLILSTCGMLRTARVDKNTMFSRNPSRRGYQALGCALPQCLSLTPNFNARHRMKGLLHLHPFKLEPEHGSTAHKKSCHYYIVYFEESSKLVSGVLTLDCFVVTRRIE